MLLAWLAFIACLVGCDRSSHGKNVELTVAAAASLRGVLPDLIQAFESEHPRVRVNAAFGASGDLRKRVADGAPVDAVLLASADPVDQLVDSGHVVAPSRKVVAGNSLVLIAPTSSELKLDFASIDELPDGERLAVGEPGAVPAGAYAKTALTNLGKWSAISKRLVFGGDVSAVLAYARRGEVAAAIVYSTEIRGIDGVKVLDVADGDWAPSPEVVVGLVSDAEHEKQASRFLEFVAGPRGQRILRAHGFGPP